MALASNALTTIALLKAEFGIADGDNSNNAKIETAIDAASTQIESHCNRSFYVETGIVEQHPGHSDVFLFVDKRPLTSITSITYDGSTIDSDQYAIHDADQGSIYRRDGWIWTGVAIQGTSRTLVGGTEERLFEVTYDAGFVIPADLERAATIQAAFHYRSVGADFRRESEKLGPWAAKYTAVDPTAAGLLPIVAAMISKYADPDMA